MRTECAVTGPPPEKVAGRRTDLHGGAHYRREILTMPFPLIPTALGVCFFLVWAFIGGLILRDGQLAAQRERECDGRWLRAARKAPRRKAA
jgi:hypothetical protein